MWPLMCVRKKKNNRWGQNASLCGSLGHMWALGHNCVAMRCVHSLTRRMLSEIFWPFKPLQEKWFCEQNRKRIMDGFLQRLQMRQKFWLTGPDVGANACTCIYTHKHIVMKPNTLRSDRSIRSVAIFTAPLVVHPYVLFSLPFFLSLSPVSHWLSKLVARPHTHTHTHKWHTNTHMDSQIPPPQHTHAGTQTCTPSFFFLAFTLTYAHGCVHRALHLHLHTHKVEDMRCLAGGGFDWPSTLWLLNGFTAFLLNPHTPPWHTRDWELMRAITNVTHTHTHIATQLAIWAPSYCLESIKVTPQI